MGSKRHTETAHLTPVHVLSIVRPMTDVPAVEEPGQEPNIVGAALPL